MDAPAADRPRRESLFEDLTIQQVLEAVQADIQEEEEEYQEGLAEDTSGNVVGHPAQSSELQTHVGEAGIEDLDVLAEQAGLQRWNEAPA
jgi:hypothetical protein